MNSSRCEIVASPPNFALRTKSEIWHQDASGCRRVDQVSYDFLIGGDPSEFFYIVHWPEKIWILESNLSTDGFVHALRQDGVPFFSYSIDSIPLSWRHWIWGILPIFPLVRPGEFPLSSLPEEIAVPPV